MGAESKSQVCPILRFQTLIVQVRSPLKHRQLYPCLKTETIHIDVVSFQLKQDTDSQFVQTSPSGDIFLP